MVSNQQEINALIGSWKLVSYELRLASGKLEKPMGDRPVGRILYLQNGQMSAQVMGSATDPLANADPEDASLEEAARAWRNYMGYWGTYEIDAAAGAVTHNVEGSWLPNWVGKKQIRKFRLTGDQLTLEAETPSWRATLVWERID